MFPSGWSGFKGKMWYVGVEYCKCFLSLLGVGYPQTGSWEPHRTSNSSRSHITENRSHIAENRSHITENRSHITENRSHITENRSHIAENRSHITENRSHITEIDHT